MTFPGRGGSSDSPSPNPRSRPLVVLTGAHGQLGETIAERLADRWSIVALGRRELDLADSVAIREMVARLRPDLIVNCAAYTDVDGAETAARHALAVNALGVGALARAARDVGATLVHYSTDFVFDGKAATPYVETVAPEPQSVYAQSKLVGEWLAADAPVHYVLRVESLFGGPRAKSSIDRIIDAISGSTEARVFVDRTVSPSFVDDVAEATAALVASGAAPGVYHCVNSGSATWLDVARHVAGRLGREDAAITPVSVKDVKLTAKRPQFAALSNEKLARAAFRMPSWQDALDRHLARMAR